MESSITELILTINQIYKKQDDLYHEYAAHHGLSDTAFWILYSLYTTDEIYTQNMLAEMWHFPKQSINSAVSTLVKTGYVRLEQMAVAQNNKALRLSEIGSEFCRKAILSFCELEERALLKMDEKDCQQLINLLTEQYHLLKEEIQAALSISKSENEPTEKHNA